MVKDTNLGRFFELASSDKIYVNSLNLHEIKIENLQDYTIDFELNGLMIIGTIERKTNIRFKNMNDFESYINAIDIDYDCEDVTSTGYFYILETPQFKMLNEVLTPKVPFLCKKLLNIMDKTIIFLRVVTFLQNVLFIFLKKIKEKNFKLLFGLKNIDQE